MQNLKYPVKKILLNSLTTADLGLYEDYQTRKKVLTFKKIGLHIQGDTYTGGGNTPAASTTLMTGFQGFKVCTDAGVLTAKLVLLDPSCPCEDCDYNYGIEVFKKVKEPGTNNADYRQHARFYGGELEMVDCTSGSIIDADVLTMENDIITQIANDRTKGVIKGAIVNAYRFYKVTVGAATDQIFIYDSTGTALGTAILLNGGSTLANAQIINADADVNTTVFAFALNTTEIGIRSLNNGGLFTIADGGGATAITIGNRYIWLEAKDVDEQFGVRTGAKSRVIRNIASVENVAFFKLQSTTTAGTTALNVDGVATGNANDHTTASTYAGNINTVLLAAGIAVTTAYASYNTTADVTYVYGANTVNTVLFTFSSTSTTTFAVASCAEGRFPYLTADEVFREFAYSEHQGEFYNLTYGNQPTQGIEYCKYVLRRTTDNVPNLHGANHYDAYVEQVEIYMPKSVVATFIWDNANPAGTGAKYTFMQESSVAGFSASTSFEGLLQIWSGVAVTSWTNMV